MNRTEIKEKYLQVTLSWNDKTKKNIPVVLKIDKDIHIMKSETVIEISTEVLLKLTNNPAINTTLLHL